MKVPGFQGGDIRLDQAVVAFHKWLLNTKNLNTVFWSCLSGMSVATVLLLGFGVIDGAISNNMSRGEAINQVINAFFTFLILCLHPGRCIHAHMLHRWNPSDQAKLRQAYCKNGTRKPNDWFHLLVVIALLQLNCIGQYIVCYFNLHYSPAERPGQVLIFWLVVSLSAAVGAGVYCSHSPLGKDYEAIQAQPVDMDKLDERSIKL